jgi:formylglycine-generating enzyme required for sulfatase activity
VRGGRRLGVAVALVALAVGLWWLGTPEEVASRTATVELPEEWEVVVAEVNWVEAELNSQPDTAYRPALVSVRGGTFLMGSPEDARKWTGDREAARDEFPQHELTIPAFQMCETEVTQGQYESVMGINPSYCLYGCGKDLPVQSLSWFDAVAYLNRLTELESEARVAEGEAPLSACYAGSGAEVRWVSGCTGYRLPTEAEWEYAARAGTTTSWSFGEDPALAATYTWYDGNGGGRAHAVGTKKANPWGIYDFHGNVWEWVWDVYYWQVGVKVSDNGSNRVLRGGSFTNSPGLLRSALRLKSPSTVPGPRFGFRCARGAGPQR